MVGSRYQTASQAAFSMGEKSRVTFLPRDQKEMDEWPDLRVSEGQGPGMAQTEKSGSFCDGSSL